MKNFVKLAWLVLGFSIQGLNANPIATIVSGTWTIAGSIDIGNRWYGKSDSYNLLLDLDNNQSNQIQALGSCGDCSRLAPGSIQNGIATAVTGDSFDRPYNPEYQMEWAGRVTFHSEPVIIALQSIDGLFVLPSVPFDMTGHVVGLDRRAMGVAGVQLPVDSDVQGHGILTMYGNQVNGNQWIYSSRYEFGGTDLNELGFETAGGNDGGLQIQSSNVPEPSGGIMVGIGVLWFVMVRVLNARPGKIR